MATNDAQTRLLEGLNEDLRGEFQAIIMYRLYASMGQGPSPTDAGALAVSREGEGLSASLCVGCRERL
jgi:bacterioferritin (cytochrome b1)